MTSSIEMDDLSDRAKTAAPDTTHTSTGAQYASDGSVATWAQVSAALCVSSQLAHPNIFCNEAVANPSLAIVYLCFLCLFSSFPVS